MTSSRAGSSHSPCRDAKALRLGPLLNSTPVPLASAIRSTERGSDCAYRIGGDEFAVILDGTSAWNALEFAQRLNASLAATNGVSVSASAGISEALTFTEKDALIREADLALIAVKRSGQEVALYTAEMKPQVATADDANIEHHTRTLAKALALAVDAKDSYTRSHSQTVSQLCALIATQLGFDAKHQAQIRLAGLLHDVGKIGTPTRSSTSRRSSPTTNPNR